MNSSGASYSSSQSGQNTILPLPAANANVTRKRKTTTCDHCKRKHVKCEPVHTQPGVESCKQCQKNQVACTQTRTAIRFSDVSSKIAKLNNTAEPSSSGIQPKAKRHRRLVYVDETAELTALYKEDDNETDMGLEYASIGREYDGTVSATSESLHNNIPTDANLNIQTNLQSLPSNRVPSPYTSSDVLPGSFILRGLVKPPDSASPRYNTLEFCLLGYYIDHLSMWLDLCDPERHFHQVVPQRARSCPPLMNAILAASARHLTRVPKYRMESGAIKYGGRILNDLTDETALHYHSKCIQDLLELGANPEQTGNEDLLAAAIILRFYEEIDYPLQDEQKDDEVFLRVLNMFIEAQIPNMAASSQPSLTATGEISTSPGEIYSSPSSNVFGNATLESRWYISSLRQAAFWVAFRQEVYSAFLKQRPFSMSLSRCDIFRSFTPGEDGLWTARLVIFCADILEFCYGNTAHSTPTPTPHSNSTQSQPQPQTKERWAQLKCLSQKWIDSLPSGFEPIYVRQPDRRQGEVFPEICYLTNIHVAGVQHIELARILLAVYDPDIPKLGLGRKESMRALSEELRAAVLRLCGIAVYNRQNPPSLTTALLGIVVCGEHFDDRGEQMALMELLDELDYHHGWPVGDYRERLKQSWGWP